MATTTIEKQEAATAAPERVEEAPRYMARVDVFETGEAYFFCVDLPGAKPDDVNVTYEDGTLTIDARVQSRQPQDQEFVAHEFGVGHFIRCFTISAPVDSAGIQAELKNGELTLTVPKTEAAKTRKIPINAS